jgi:hypothetical protein
MREDGRERMRLDVVAHAVQVLGTGAQRPDCFDWDPDEIEAAVYLDTGNRDTRAWLEYLVQMAAEQ